MSRPPIGVTHPEDARALGEIAARHDRGREPGRWSLLGRLLRAETRFGRAVLASRLEPRERVVYLLEAAPEPEPPTPERDAEPGADRDLEAAWWDEYAEPTESALVRVVEEARPVGVELFVPPRLRRSLLWTGRERRPRRRRSKGRRRR